MPTPSGDNLRKAEDSPLASLSSSLNAELNRQSYEAVEMIAKTLQPSHAESGGKALDPDAAANILAFTQHLLEEQCEHSRQAVAQEYQTLAAFRAAEKKFTATCGCFEGQGEVKHLADNIISYYLNIYAYHNAEHMLTMARDCVRFGGDIAEQQTLEPKAKARMLKRLFVSGLYHDTGNGRFPRQEKGRDELDALRTFLIDFNNSGAPELQFLADLEVDEILRIAANIMGTVFLDRHADPAILAKGAYVDQAVALLAKQGVAVEREAFVDLLLSQEAMVVKNADIAASLEPGKLIKSTFTVYFENVLKSEVFYGKSFADFHRGFLSLLKGKLQTALHGVETPLSKEAQQGNLLINPGGQADVFTKRNGNFHKTEQEFLLTLAYDYEICEAMSRVIEDNVRQGWCDVLSQSLRDTGQDLELFMGAEAYAPYRRLLEEQYADRSLIDLTQEEVNSIFQMHTKEVQQILQRAKKDPRTALQELAAAHPSVRPNTWQGRYIVEVLRYFCEHSNDESLEVRTLLESTKALVRQGEKSAHAYIVLAGPGNLTVRGSEQQVLSTISAVNVAGEMSILKGARTADLFVEEGPVRIAVVPEEAVRQISSHRHLQDALSSGVAARLARGDVVTNTDDQKLRKFLEKLFTFNLSIEDPIFSEAFQTALKREELVEEGQAFGWEMRQLDPGEQFITFGTEPEYIYVVTEGEVIIDLPTPQDLIHRGPGTLLGEISLISSDKKATADVAAGEKGAAVICLPREFVACCPKAVEFLARRRLASQD